MPVASELVARISADDQLSGPLDQMSGKISGFAKGASALGSVATAAFVGIGAAAVGLGAGIASSISKATEFQQGIADVGALVNATTPQMEALSAAALALGQDTTLSGIGATDAARAMQELAAAGFSVEAMTSGATRGVLLLASATGTDVAKAAEIAGDTFNAFRESMGLTAADMPRIANLFTGAANVSSIGLTDIGESMKYIGPIAASMGISMEDVTAAIAALGNQGIKGSMAGTALRSVISSLAKPSKEASKVISNLGLEFFDAGGNMKDFSGISGELKSKMAKLTDQQRASALVTLFGNEALSAANVLYGEGSDGIKQYMADIAKQGDAAAIGATRNNTLRGSIESFKGALETAQITLGQAFLPSLKGLVDWATKGVAAAIPLIQAWGPQLVAGIQSAIAVIGQFGGYVSSAIGAVVGAFQSLQSGQTTLAGFIGGVKTLISTVIGDIGGLLGQAATFIAPYMAAIGSAITTALPIIGAELGQLASMFGSWIQTTAIPYLQANLPVWLAALAGWISGTAAPAVSAAIIAVANSFSGWITGTAIPYLQANLPLWLAAITGWITSTALPAITAAVIGLSAALVSWIKGEDVAAQFTGWQGAVLQGLANVSGLLTEFASIAGPMLVEWIKSEETQAKFGELLAAVAGGTAEILSALAAFSGEAGVAVHEWLANQGPLWLHDWGELASVTGQGIATIAGMLDAWEQEQVGKFGAWMGNMFSALGTGLSNMLAAINNWINTAGPAWLHSWSALGEAMTTALGQMVADAGAAMGRLGAAILGGLSGLIPQGGGIAGQIGAAIVAGLVNGIMAGAGQVASAAAAIVTGALQAARDAIKSKSPSRKFMELGNDAIEGLIIGMDQKQAEAAAKSAQVATAVAKAATDVLGAMRAISTFDFGKNTPSGGQLAGLTASTTGIIGAMQDAAANFKADGLKAASDFADAAGKVGGSIKNTLDGLAALAGFDFAKSTPSGSALAWFTHLATSLVANFAIAAQMFADGALKDASDFADAAGKVGGSVKNTLEGLQALASADWAKSSPTGSAMGWFTHLAASLVANFATAATLFADGALKGASDFADAASKVGGAVKAALGGLQDLASADWAKSSPTGGAMAWFTLLVSSLVQNFATAAAAFDADVLASANRLAETAGKVAAVIGPALAGFKELATIVAPSQTSIDQLVAGIKYLVQRFGEMAATMASEGVKALGDFSDAANKALGAAKTGTDLFKSFDKLVIPSAKAIDDLSNGVAYVVQKFRDMAGMLQGEGLAATVAFSDGAAKVIGAAKGAADLFSTMKNLQVPPPAVIDYLLGSMGYVITQTQAIANGIGTAGIQAAQAFSTGVLNVFTTIKTTLENFAKLTAFKDIPQQVMQAMFVAMEGALERAGDLNSRADAFMVAALDYKGKMLAAAAAFAVGQSINVQSGGSALDFSGPIGGGALTIPGLATGGIVTKPTLIMAGEGNKPEAIVPLSQMGRYGGGGGGGGNVTVVVQGNVYGVDQMRQVVADAVAGASPSQRASMARSLESERGQLVTTTW